MPKGFFNVPKAVNEPVKSYAPNSPEKAAVLAAYKKMWKETIDVPMYIGSEQIKTGNTKTMSAPHDHKHIVGTYHLAEKSHVEKAIASVKGTLIEIMITVSLVVLLFLFHWRSALIILIQLPISVSIGFILLEAFGISSNIMSLTGIALAIGVVVDDGIVMVENAYRTISEKQEEMDNNQ